MPFGLKNVVNSGNTGSSMKQRRSQRKFHIFTLIYNLEMKMKEQKNEEVFSLKHPLILSRSGNFNISE